MDEALGSFVTSVACRLGRPLRELSGSAADYLCSSFLPLIVNAPIRTTCRSRMLRYVTISIGLVVLHVSVGLHLRVESISLGVCHIAEQM